MAATLNLVNAATGKRLGAWLVDKALPVLAAGIALGISLPALADPAGATARLIVPVLLAGVLGAAYQIWIWGWEATAGKTPGNVLFGLRTTNEAGLPAGWAGIFLRGLIVAVGSVVPVIGSLLVVISNLWDAGHRRQGWHDKVAKTLVVDVRAGRDPLITGGLYGAGSLAPGGSVPGNSGPGYSAPDNSVSRVQAPSEPSAAPAPASFGGPGSAGPITGIPSFDARHPQPAAQPEPAPVFSEPLASEPLVPAPVTFAPAASALETSALVTSAPGAGDSLEHPDLEAGATRLKTTVPLPAAVRIRFDDGQEVTVTGAALLGRNPAAGPGERVDQLIDFADMSRSVSKTHLSLSVDSAGVWVTDRNSTNGTAVTAPGTAREQVRPGESARAGIGSTVHFGDRSFVVGRV